MQHLLADINCILLAQTSSNVDQQLFKRGYHVSDNRDDEVALTSAGPRANHLHLAPDRKPHHQVITQIFLQSDVLADGPTNRIKALKTIKIIWKMATKTVYMCAIVHHLGNYNMVW